VVAPDPVDIRLLSLVAESGRAAVHDIAARVGMDPREVAARLTALSATGLPLIVGVECDPNGLRAAIAGASPWLNYAAQGGSSGPHRTQTGPYPQQAPPMPPPGYAQPMPAAPYPAPAAQSGPYPAPGGPSGPYPAAAGPSGPYPAPSGPHAVPAGPPRQGPPGADPVSTWGPPQSSSWARGDQPARAAAWTPPPAPQLGRVGETLRGDGADGEQVTIQLVEVVDPADFLFTAAGYRLRPGERSVVVHTELTNQGSIPLGTLPDLYLVLVAKDGQAVGKAPVSLSSRPPHRMGLRPGETAGGHTVYVLPENTEITSVRWSARPDDEQHALIWAVQP
jgi:AsnC-type helix-turn-helix domain